MPPPVVLTLVAYYPPAFRAGGPTRSLPRIAELLEDEARFRVITRNGDLGTPDGLTGIAPDRWVACGAATCLYLSTGPRLVRRLLAALRHTEHDVLYLNGIFSAEFDVLPLVLRRVRVLPRRRLIVAPRGELNLAALAIKDRRKALYLRLARRLGLFRGTTWHAATEAEAQAVRRVFGGAEKVLVAVDLPAPPAEPSPPPPKLPGRLDVAFLGRISPMKNLDFALDVLMGAEGDVRFDIYGPVDDEAYWQACQARIARLPINVTATYRGLVDPHEVSAVFHLHHLLLLPSRGESFGHVIVEALGAGCPVLVSDQTPFVELERRRAGWDLPLASPARFTEVINRCVAMDDAELARWSAGARALAADIANDPDRDAAYRKIFAVAAGPGGAG